MKANASKIIFLLFKLMCVVEPIEPVTTTSVLGVLVGNLLQVGYRHVAILLNIL